LHRLKIVSTRLDRDGDAVIARLYRVFSHIELAPCLIDLQLIVRPPSEKGDQQLKEILGRLPALQSIATELELTERSLAYFFSDCTNLERIESSENPPSFSNFLNGGQTALQFAQNCVNVLSKTNVGINIRMNSPLVCHILAAPGQSPVSLVAFLQGCGLKKTVDVDHFIRLLIPIIYSSELIPFLRICASGSTSSIFPTLEQVKDHSLMREFWERLVQDRPAALFREVVDVIGPPNFFFSTSLTRQMLNLPSWDPNYPQLLKELGLLHLSPIEDKNCILEWALTREAMCLLLESFEETEVRSMLETKLSDVTVRVKLLQTSPDRMADIVEFYGDHRLWSIPDPIEFVTTLDSVMQCDFAWDDFKPIAEASIIADDSGELRAAALLRLFYHANESGLDTKEYLDSWTQMVLSSTHSVEPQYFIDGLAVRRWKSLPEIITCCHELVPRMIDLFRRVAPVLLSQAVDADLSIVTDLLKSLTQLVVAPLDPLPAEGANFLIAELLQPLCRIYGVRTGESPAVTVLALFADLVSDNAKISDHLASAVFSLSAGSQPPKSQAKSEKQIGEHFMDLLGRTSQLALPNLVKTLLDYLDVRTLNRVRNGENVMDLLCLRTNGTNIPNFGQLMRSLVARGARLSKDLSNCDDYELHEHYEAEEYETQCIECYFEERRLEPEDEDSDD
jgi:hypothetical protein